MQPHPASFRLVAGAACVAAAILAVLPPPAIAQPSVAPSAAAGICVTVEIRNVRAGQGQLFIGAYGDEAAFAARKPSQGLVLRPTEDAVRVPLCGVSAASLAVLVYQDLNDNGRMDANPFGVPSEPYGSSGRPAAMAPPSWERARVERSAPGGVVVVLSS